MKKVFNNQYVRNLSATIVFFVLNTAINLYLTPFYIRKLGIEIYSLLPLIVSITGYFGLITTSFNMSVSRFLSLDVKNKRYEEANEVFNTSVFGSLALILFLVPVLFLFSYFSDSIFEIPVTAVRVAPMFFFSVGLSFLVAAFRTNFIVSPYILNRLDIVYVIHIIELVIRLFIVYFALQLFNLGLIWIGVSYLVASIIALISALGYWKKLTPYLRINLTNFRRSLLKNIFGMGGWVIVNQIGTLFFLNIDIIVSNKLFSPKLAGVYGSILQILIYLRALANLLSKQFTPTFYSYYATGDTKKIVKLSNSGIELMGAILAIPIGLIVAYPSTILNLWLGKDFVQYSSLLVLLVLPAGINLPIRIMFSIQQAYNKVKVPGIITLILGLVNIFLAIALPLYLGWGLMGIAAANAIVLTAKNLFFTPLYCSSIMKVKLSNFTLVIAKNILFVLVIILIAKGLDVILEVETLYEFLLACIISVSVYLVFMYFIFNKENRLKIISLLKK